MTELYSTGNLHECRTSICKLNSDQIIELGNLANVELCTSGKTMKHFYRFVIDLCNHYKTQTVSFKGGGDGSARAPYNSKAPPPL